MATKTKYQKKTQLEHILHVPDTYIGSVEKDNVRIYVPSVEIGNEGEEVENESLEGEEGKEVGNGTGKTKIAPKVQMVQKDLTIVSGFIKLFDEVISNAADNYLRGDGTQTIKVTVDRTNGSINVWNDGKGIPIEIHETEGIYVGQMIFGELLTSSNYDKDKNKKTTGGKNGYGVKLVNIYSTKFLLETYEASTGQVYRQEWADNMSTCKKPKITKAKKKADYTSISYYPDFPRFHMSGIDDDTYEALWKRTYDLAGATAAKGLKVYWQGTLLMKARDNFGTYVSLYYPDSTQFVTDTSTGLGLWEVAIGPSDGSFSQISFVNTILTSKGGSHVNLVADKVTEFLVEAVKKKTKTSTLKPSQIKNQLFVFVNATIENPSFDSQTKEHLTTRRDALASSWELSDSFKKKLTKLGFIDEAIAQMRQKDVNLLKKTDAKRGKNLVGVESLSDKLSDAEWARTRNGYKCTLFVCEGDSASGQCKRGIESLADKPEGKMFGVFPLRGKLLNVREASDTQLAKNVEIKALKQIIGLREGENYTDVKGLRYGRLCIMTDADEDGKHIKGLILNWIAFRFPSLLRIEGFVVDFITPIVRVSGSGIRGKLSFYSQVQFREWSRTNGNKKGLTIEYYKGIGSNQTEEMHEYFNDLDKHIKEFKIATPVDEERLDMVFNKTRANDRKEWLTTYDPESDIDIEMSKLSINDFIDKSLIHFSMYDNIRNIPSLVDGLKPGQRKIIYTAFKKNLDDPKGIKVFQFGAKVAELSHYHHGDVSLSETITKMAQNFVGSNNINLLMPKGAFGSRDMGGRDRAAPRYIFTYLNPLTRKIFPAPDDDLLDYQIEENETIEPRYYVPILPMCLVNGCEGIGTGYSTSIPNHDPLELIAIIRLKLKGETGQYEKGRLRPFYFGHTGRMEGGDDGKYICYGNVRQVDGETIVIDELPVGTWTDKYKAFLTQLVVKGEIKDYTEQYQKSSRPHFTITVEPDRLAKLGDLFSFFKLQSTINTSNMLLFDKDGHLRKYRTVDEIIDEFYGVRLDFYKRRKEDQLSKLRAKLLFAENKIRFIKALIGDTLVIRGLKKSLVHDLLVSQGYALKDDGYDYLTGMPIHSVTQERYESLQKECQDLQMAIDELLALSAEDLWVRDLDVLEAGLVKFYQDLSEAPEKKPTVLASKTNKPVKRSRVQKDPATVKHTPKRTKKQLDKIHSDEIDLEI